MLRIGLILAIFHTAVPAVLAQPLEEPRRLPPIEGPILDELRGPQAVDELPQENDEETPNELDDAAGEDAPDDEVSDKVDAEIYEPWYEPEIFCDTSYWESSFEFGINGTTGNTESMSFRVGSDVKRKDKCNTLALNIAYARTTADGAETQHNALLSLRDDWDLFGSPWSLFVKETTEYDEFKNFDLRWAANGGLGYYFVKNDNGSLKGRFGAGVSQEIGGTDGRYKPEAVFGVDYEKQLTKKQKLEVNLEYLPEWNGFTNFRAEAKASWAIQLDAAANLSLKLSVIDRYDSTPEGNKPNDLDYALLLLWKL